MYLERASSNGRVQGIAAGGILVMGGFRMESAARGKAVKTARSWLRAWAGACLAAALAAGGVSAWSVLDLGEGAARLNDAGRLRMKAYRVLAAALEAGQAQRGVKEQALAKVEQACGEFEEGLEREQRQAGGPMLSRASARWHGLAKPAALALASDAAAGELAAAQSELLAEDLDGYVEGLQEGISGKARRSLSLLGMLGFMGMAAAAGAGWRAGFGALGPIRKLSEGFKALASGSGAAKMELGGPAELAELGERFDTMAEKLSELRRRQERKAQEQKDQIARWEEDFGLLFEVFEIFSHAQGNGGLAGAFAKALGRSFGAGRVMVEVREEGEPAARAEEACGDGAQDEGASGPSQGEQWLLAAGAAPVSVEVKMYAQGGFAGGLRRQMLAQVLCRAFAMQWSQGLLRRRSMELALAGERDLMAQGVHDSVAQALAFMGLQTAQLREALDAGDWKEAQALAEMMEEGIFKANSQARELISRWRRKAGRPAGEQAAAPSLAAALLAAAETLRPHARADLEIKGAPGPWSAQYALCAGQVAKEALSNLAKHAGCRHARMELVCEPARVTLTVGPKQARHGAQGQAWAGPAKGYGLELMARRALQAGARLSFVQLGGGVAGVRLEMDKKAE